MPQRPVSLVLLMVAVAAVLATASGVSLAGAVICPRVAFAPVLDGRLDDWPPLPQMVIAEPGDWHGASPRYSDYGGARDISTDVRLAWDSQALYLAVETMDDQMVRVRSVAEIDRGDSIVLAIKGEDSAQVNQFVVALLRTASLVWRTEPAQSAGEVRTVARAITVRDEDGVKRMVYELSIPWAELRQVRPLPGAGFTLTVSACDDDGAGLKGCLERTTAVRLAAAGTGPVELADELLPVAGVTPFFPAPDKVRFDEKCFTLDGSDALLLGGEIEHWLLPEASWPTRIELLEAAGFNTVGVTVPWCHYQPLNSPPDLGELRRFLDLCKSSALWVQVSIGPFSDERLPAGGVPGWVLALPTSQERETALRGWLQALLPVIGDYQIARGGPIVSVTVKPLPGPGGAVSPGALEQLFTAVRSSDISAPVLTVNAPPARAAARKAMANVLDTLDFYEPVSVEAFAAQLQALVREEAGPAIIAVPPGDYRGPQQARHNADLVKTALAAGAAGITLSDYAPGLDPAAVRNAGSGTGGLVDPAGAVTPGYGELRLLGTFLRRFGPALVRAIPAEGVVETDAADLRAVVRYGKAQSFLFLWDEKGHGAHQVRLSYLAPDRATRISIPEAGAISLPAAGAKILLLDTPFGRGLIRYCTSEVLALHQLGDRSLLVVYGDVDTPGEIAISLPGPPLVSGEVARQAWNAQDNTLILDYYHAEKDRYLLVDELEIAVLSRERAALSGLAEDGSQATLAPQATLASQAVTLVTGANVAHASLGVQSIEATLDCRPGAAEFTAALPRAPAAVVVDGESVPFTFTSPERVLTFQITTPSFSEQQRPTSVLDKLGRAIAGGPAYLYARFDRALFRPDSEASQGGCATAERIAGAPEELGLTPGAIARLRTRFSPEGAAEMLIAGSSFPLLVSIDGKRVDALSTTGPDRRADISPFLRPGSNELEIVASILPRAPGLAGLRDAYASLPEVKLLTRSAQVALAGWEVCPSLAGEAAGYMGSDVDERPWHYIRLGPWREQGRELADVTGVGWYRMTFKLPRADGWTIPYYLSFDLRGAGKVYFDGLPVAAVQGDGAYRLPVPSSLAARDNVLALSLYGAAADTGLYRAEVAADESRTTRRRRVEIRF